MDKQTEKESILELSQLLNRNPDVLFVLKKI